MDANWQPTVRQLRQFGVAAAVLCVGFAYWLDASTLTRALGFAAVVLASAALLAPHRLRVPFVLLTALTAPIGWVVSHLILGFIYFGVVTPVGLVLRVFGRRSMELAPDPSADSYWEPRRQETGAKNYLRQS